MANDKKFIAKNGFLTADAESSFTNSTLATPTATFTNSGGVGDGNPGTGAVIATFAGDSDAMVITNISQGDYFFGNNQQNNGISFYDGTGGMRFWYNGSNKFEIDSVGTTFNDSIDVLGTITTNRLIIDDDGSSSPTVVVATDDQSPWALAIHNDTYSTTQTMGHLFYQSNAGDTYYESRGDGAYEYWYFRQNNGTTPRYAITIDSAGDVGINTTDPRSMLHTIGAGSAGEWRINDYGGMMFHNLSDPNNERYIHGRSDGTLSIGYVPIASLTGGNRGYAATSFDQITISSGGNVGIGTATPAFRLHAYHASTNVISRFESGDDEVWIDLHDSGSGTYGALLGHKSSTSTLFKIADASVSEKFTILSNGNVGLGAVNPGGNLTIYNNNPNILFEDSDTTNNGEITLDNTSLRIESDPANTTASSTIKFLVDNDEKAIILDNGNVGVGSGNPQVKLDVAGSARVLGTFNIAPASSGHTTLQLGSRSADPLPAGTGSYDFQPGMRVSSYEISGVNDETDIAFAWITDDISTSSEGYLAASQTYATASWNKTFTVSQRAGTRWFCKVKMNDAESVNDPRIAFNAGTEYKFEYADAVNAAGEAVNDSDTWHVFDVTDDIITGTNTVKAWLASGQKTYILAMYVFASTGIALPNEPAESTFYAHDGFGVRDKKIIDKSRNMTNIEKLSVGTTASSGQHPDAFIYVKGGISFEEYTTASEGSTPAITQWSSNGTAEDLAIGTRSGTGNIRFFTGNAGSGGDWGATNNALRMAIDEGGLVGINTDANAYGRLQINQTTNNDENGFGILDSTGGRSIRIWVDSTDSYVSSGDGGTGILQLNEGGGLVLISKGSTDDYTANQAGVVKKTFQVHDTYNTAGTHWVAYANLDGNWLDGATGSDSQHGWILGHGNAVRGGLIYDHRSTERMAMWSSYGRMDFLIANTTDGDGVPIDSNIVEAMTIKVGGNVGIGTTNPASNLDIRDTGTYNILQMAGSAGNYTGIKLARGDGTWSSASNNQFGLLVTDYGMEVTKLTALGDNNTGRLAAPYMQFETDTADNVGIGTTAFDAVVEDNGTPTSKFIVNYTGLLGDKFGASSTSVVWGAMEPKPIRPSRIRSTSGLGGNCYTNSFGSTSSSVVGEADLSAIDNDATFTFADAWAALETHGARMPTLSEIMAGVGQGSGQGYDSEYLWTQTFAGPHHVWVVKGAYSSTTSANHAAKIVDITDPLEVYRTRGFFDASHKNMSVHYDNNESISTNELMARGDVTAYYSDERLKDFQGTIPDALAKVNRINGYLFTENETAKQLGYNNDRVQAGVSAQEVEAVLPEVVKEAPINEDKGTDYKTVQYDRLVPLLIEAVKELSNKVEDQQAEINKLKGLE